MLMISQKPAGLYLAFPDIHLPYNASSPQGTGKQSLFPWKYMPLWGVQCRQEQDGRQAQDNFLNVVFIGAIIYVFKNISYFVPVRNRILKNYTNIPIDKTDLRQSRL